MKVRMTIEIKDVLPGEGPAHLMYDVEKILSDELGYSDVSVLDIEFPEEVKEETNEQHN